MVKIGIIGGSGLDDPDILKDYKEIEVETPYGKPSSALVCGKIKDVEVDVVRVELVNAPIEVKKTKDVKKSKTTEKKESLDEKLAEEKKEVLEKPLDKKETNAQRTVGEGKDFKMHEQLQTKEIEKKMREEKMIPHDQKPSHQKKK